MISFISQIIYEMKKKYSTAFTLIFDVFSISNLINDLKLSYMSYFFYITSLILVACNRKLRSF